MAHFAQLDKNNQVINVIVVSNSDISDENGNEVEAIGIAFCKRLLGEDTNWKQTSYSNSIRVRYATIGHFYNAELDAFVPPQPYASWVLNQETLDWESPVGSPPELTEVELGENSFYRWDEESVVWVLETPKLLE